MLRLGMMGITQKTVFFDKKNRRQSSGFNHMIYQV
jgi:hypothetical protein